MFRVKRAIPVAPGYLFFSYFWYVLKINHLQNLFVSSSSNSLFYESCEPAFVGLRDIFFSVFTRLCVLSHRFSLNTRLGCSLFLYSCFSHRFPLNTRLGVLYSCFSHIICLLTFSTLVWVLLIPCFSLIIRCLFTFSLFLSQILCLSKSVFFQCPNCSMSVCSHNFFFVENSVLEVISPFGVLFLSLSAKPLSVYALPKICLSLIFENSFRDVAHRFCVPFLCFPYVRIMVFIKCTTSIPLPYLPRPRVCAFFCDWTVCHRLNIVQFFVSSCLT